MGGSCPRQALVRVGGSEWMEAGENSSISRIHNSNERQTDNERNQRKTERARGSRVNTSNF